MKKYGLEIGETMKEAKERPILFSAEMVRAILDGRKTQTRRTKGLEVYNVGEFAGNDFDCYVDEWKLVDGKYHQPIGSAGMQNGCSASQGPKVKCPYGVIGDRLWVRETWRVRGWWPGEPFSIQYRADMSCQQMQGDSDPDWEERMWQQVTDEMDNAGIPYDEEGIYQFEGEPPLKWHPSIFMPRAASHILLENTDVRVERLQEISEADAMAEGVLPSMAWIGANENKHKAGFCALWDSINAKRGYSWESNPLVWVIEFKVIKGAE